MAAPSSDRAAIRQTIRALRKAGAQPIYVEYGDDDGEDLTPSSTEDKIIEAIMAVGDAYLIVRIPPTLTNEARETSHIRFVMGNDPDEVICDHGVSLSPILDPLTESWWS